MRRRDLIQSTIGGLVYTTLTHESKYRYTVIAMLNLQGSTKDARITF